MMDLAVIEAEAPGSVPSGWSERKLQDVAQLINGRGFKPFEWDTAGLPIIRIQNLNGSDDFNYYSGRYDPKIEVDPGQLLFAWSGSRGTSFGPHIWNGPRGVLNYHTWKVRVNESEIVPGFFFHVLRHMTRIIEDQAHGASALVHVQKWEMEKFPFQCPDDPKEQEAIAQTLSDADALIEGLERLIAKKRLIKQGAMQELLTAKRRLPGFSGEWVERKLGDLAKVVTGRTPPTSQSAYYGNEYPFVSPADIGRVKRIGAAQKMLSLAGFKMASPIPAGSILFVCIGSVGKIGVAGRELATNQQINAAIPFAGVDPDFLYYALDHLAPQIAAQAGEQVLPIVNKTSFEGVAISVPDTTEQRAIGQALDDMDAEIQALETRLEKARAVREGMMQNLLTGRIRLF